MSVFVTFPLIAADDTFPVAKGQDVKLLIWTTQPWTIPANQLVCFLDSTKYCLVRPTDDMCSPLLVVASDCLQRVTELTSTEFSVIYEFDSKLLNGLQYRHPLGDDRVLRLQTADHVSTDKGTGLVHTAPAHGLEDFATAQGNNLSVKSNVDDEGRFTVEAGHSLEGKFIFTDGNDAIIQMLKDGGNLLYQHDYKHSYPYDWRTKKPIFLKTSKQWFIDTEILQHKARSVIENEVNFYPKKNKLSMLSQLGQRTYWCISRQRVWGLPIPVFYHRSSGDVIINDHTISHLISLVKQEGADVWWKLPVADLLPQKVLEESNLPGTSDDYEKGVDILDIWFDSGVSWLAALSKPDRQEAPIADLYLEGKDQYGGWFYSSLMTSIALRDTAPYKNVLVHGFAVAKDGQKMSKSLGNVVDPHQITDKGGPGYPACGADVLRWLIAESNAYQEMQISSTVIIAARDAVNKVRNSLRFMISNLNDFLPDVDVTGINRELSIGTK